MTKLSDSSANITVQCILISGDINCKMAEEAYNENAGKILEFCNFMEISQNSRNDKLVCDCNHCGYVRALPT